MQPLKPTLYTFNYQYFLSTNWTNTLCQILSFVSTFFENEFHDLKKDFANFRQFYSFVKFFCRCLRKGNIKTDAFDKPSLFCHISKLWFSRETHRYRNSFLILAPVS